MKNLDKEKYKKYNASRGDWGLVNPVTKVIPDKKKKAKKEKCRGKHYDY